MRFLNYISLLLTMLWVISCTPENSHPTPRVQNGIIALQNWDFSENIALKGQWEFYWNQFRTHNFPTDSLTYLQVPGSWHEYRHHNQEATGDGHATYRVRIKLPEGNQRYALKILTISTATEIYVNGEKKFTSGKIGTTAQEMSPAYKTGVIAFEAKNQEVEIVILASNYYHKKGGIWESMVFGQEAQIRQTRNRIYHINFFILGSILIMMLYHLGLYYKQRHDLAPLYFSIFTFLVVLHLLVSWEVLINLIIPLPWSIVIRLDYISVYAMPVVFSLFLNTLLPNQYSRYLHLTMRYLAALLTGITLFLSPKIFTQLIIPWELIILVYLLHTTYELIRATYKGEQNAGAILIGFVILLLTVVNDILYQNGVLLILGNLMAFGVFAFIFAQAYVLSVQFSVAFLQIKQLSENLDFQNQHLEELVVARTQQINEQKEVIEQSHKKITDSILYAKRIQEALMPARKLIAEAFAENFVLFQPRDVVSGDFYWAKDFSEYFVLAAADCTGHGVPGGFLSMLGMSLLNEEANNITLNTKNEPASYILDRLRDKVKTAFHDTEADKREHRDGMDLALCIFHKKTKTLLYAGANSPVYIARKNTPDMQLIEGLPHWQNDACTLYRLKGNAMPVANYHREKPFESYTLQLQTDDIIYLCSDGISDQFEPTGTQKFQISRLRKFFLHSHEQPLETQKETLKQQMADWIGTGQQIDDVLVIGVKMK